MYNDYHGQNLEDKIVAQYFGQYVGTLLSIGENTGTVYSNALHFINNGWKATLVEPSRHAFDKLWELHQGDKNVYLANVAITNENAECVIYESGDFLLPGTTSLLSTLKVTELNRWGNPTFAQGRCRSITFDALLEMSPYKTFEYITLDAEGMDIEIMRQIDFSSIGCRCLVIEWNSLPYIAAQIKEYVEPFGLKEIHSNGENKIYAK